MRVAIEEDSDEEDEEPTIQEVGANKLVSKKIDSKFPLESKKDIDAHAREAKLLMKKGGAAFVEKFKNRHEEPVLEPEHSKSTSSTKPKIEELLTKEQK